IASMFLLRNRVTNEPRTLQRNLCIAAQRTCVACSVPKSNSLNVQTFSYPGFRHSLDWNRGRDKTSRHFAGGKAALGACDSAKVLNAIYRIGGVFKGGSVNGGRRRSESLYRRSVRTTSAIVFR